MLTNANGDGDGSVDAVDSNGVEQLQQQLFITVLINPKRLWHLRTKVVALAH